MNHLPLIRRLAARSAATLPQFAILAILARTTPLGDFGAFAAGQGLAAVLIGFAGCGLATTLVAQSEDDRLLRSSFQVIGLGLVPTLPALAIWSWTQDARSAIIVALVLYMASELTGNLMQSWLFGTLRGKHGDAFLFLRRALPCVTVGGALLSSADPYLGLALGYAATLYPLVVFRREIAEAPTQAPVSLVRRSRHLWQSDAFAMLQQLDIVMVSAFLGRAPAGAYGAAFRFASPVHILTSTFATIEVPKLARMSPQERRTAERRFLRTGVAYAAVVAVAAAPYAWLVPPLLGEAFVDYRAVFAVLMVNSALSVVSQFLSSVLTVRRDSRVIGVASGVSTLVGLALCLAAASSGSIVGAALGTASIQVVLTALLFIRYRRGS